MRTDSRTQPQGCIKKTQSTPDPQRSSHPRRRSNRTRAAAADKYRRLINLQHLISKGPETGQTLKVRQAEVMSICCSYFVLILVNKSIVERLHKKVCFSEQDCHVLSRPVRVRSAVLRQVAPLAGQIRFGHI